MQEVRADQREKPPGVYKVFAKDLQLAKAWIMGEVMC